MKKTLAAIALYLAVGTAAAQRGPVSPEQPPMMDFNGISFTMADFATHTFSMDSSWGHVTVDTSSNMIYLATSAGIQEFGAGQAFTAAGISSTSVNFELSYPGIHRPVMTTFDNGGLFGPCAFSPCQRSVDPVDGRYIYTTEIPYTPPTGHSGGGNVPLIQDQNGFDNWRDSRCEFVLESALQSSLEAPAVGMSCALAEMGVPAAVCAGGLAKQAWDAVSRASASSDCNAKYPGPGRWKGSLLPVDYIPQ